MECWSFDGVLIGGVLLLLVHTSCWKASLPSDTGSGGFWNMVAEA